MSGSSSVTIKQARCAGCHEPLAGKLFATGCGHVFHPGCVPQGMEPCPKCGEDNTNKPPYELFGADFSTCRQQVVAPLRRQVEEKKALLEAARTKETLSLREAEKQEQKLQEAKAAFDKHSAERKDLQERLLASSDDAEKLGLQTQELRESGTVEEYMEKLDKKGEVEALQFLQKCLPFAQDPAITLAHVRRFRDKYREKTKDLQKQNGVMAKEEQQKKMLSSDLTREVCSRHVSGKGKRPRFY
mmetsp:Transcript_64845/g.154823  ORF Transcript_64845/g.154823 Transcript_64845/m.154823 type:complete len:244 (+) Transcript_64845:56-787(+)